MPSFPAQDVFWADTANFVEAHRQSLEPLLAPAAFSDRLAGVSPHTPSLETADSFSWAIIHKGTLEALRCDVLKAIARKFKPVFANEVFVIFSKRKDLPAIDRDAPHLKAFQAGLKDYQKRMGRSFRFQLGDQVFELSAKSSQPLQPLSPEDIQPALVELPQPAASPAELPPQRQMIYLGDHRALTRTLWGHKIFVDTRDMSLTPHILLDGYWERWITDFFLSRIEEGMTVIDVGANIGYYTLLAAAQVGASGQVFAFEANPLVFETLAQNVEINGFRDRTTLVNQAVHSHTTTLKFNRFQSHHGSSTTRNLPEGFAEEYYDQIETIEVPAVSLDEALGAVPKIDLIKMDAEGSEIFIFKGLKNVLKSNPQIQIIFEFYPKFILENHEDPRAFLEDIQRYGFQFHEVMEDSTLMPLTIDEILASSRYRELFIQR